MTKPVPRVARSLLIYAAAALVLAAFVSANAAQMQASGNGAGKNAAKPSAKKKTTDVSFEDVLVQGKYHFSDEAVTTVEEDKVLDGLLNVRKDFKDRMQRSAARE